MEHFIVFLAQRQVLLLTAIKNNNVLIQLVSWEGLGDTALDILLMTDFALLFLNFRLQYHIAVCSPKDLLSATKTNPPATPPAFQQ